MGLVSDFLKAISKIAIQHFSLEDTCLKFKIKGDTFFKYKVENFDIKTRHDPYAIESYTLNADDLYLEYVEIDEEAKWNFNPSTSFLDLFKKEMNVKTMVNLEKRSFKYYDFYVYRINEKYIINFIHIQDINKEIFIIDQKAELYEELLKKIVDDYHYMYDKNKIKIFDFNFSLTKRNAINNYFSY